MEKPQSTKERILDAAEKLFATRGFYGVSIRQITTEAEVDPALASYHFGKKKDIFNAVMLRRAEVLNGERIAMLDDCIRRARPNPAPLNEIIDAFTHALLNRATQGGQGWKNYFAIIAQINNHPELGAIIMTQYFDPLAKKFIAAIHETMPESDPEDLYWCYHFLSGALTLTFSGTERISNLSEGLCTPSDLYEVHDRLVPFITAGFKVFAKAHKIDKVN